MVRPPQRVPRSPAVRRAFFRLRKGSKQDLYGAYTTGSKIIPYHGLAESFQVSSDLKTEYVKLIFGALGEQDFSSQPERLDLGSLQFSQMSRAQAALVYIQQWTNDSI